MVAKHCVFQLGDMSVNHDIILPTTTCNTEGNDETCVSTETFFVVNISENCSPSPHKNRETVQVTGADWRHLLGLFGLNEAEGTPEIQFEEWKVRLRDSQTVYLYNNLLQLIFFERKRKHDL